MIKSPKRIKSTGEIFTPPALVDEITDRQYRTDPTLFTDDKKLFLDLAGGTGNLLLGVVRKIASVRKNFTKKDWKHTITYQVLGVDIMWDNVCDTVYYLLRSNINEKPKTDKAIAYKIIKEFRGKKPRQEVLRIIQQATGCTEKAAVPLYSWTTYQGPSRKSDVKLKKVTTKYKKNHIITEHSSLEEINAAFESRIYVDDVGTLIFRQCNGSNHHVEYKIDNQKKWTRVDNIVRANSLTEWDFKNWQPTSEFLLNFWSVDDKR